MVVKHFQHKVHRRITRSAAYPAQREQAVPDGRLERDDAAVERVFAASLSANPHRPEVTKSVFRSGPPNAGMVGNVNGSRSSRSTLPSGSNRISFPWPLMADQ